MIKKLVKNHGKPRWKVDFGKQLIEGRWKRHVKFFAEETDADKAMRAAEKDRAAIGKRWTQLPPEERAKVVEVLEEMAAAGHSLAQVWDAFRIERMTPVDETKRRTLRQAIDELLVAKRSTNKRESYIESLEQYLSQFARGRESMPVDRITVADVEKWFDGRKEAQTTRASNMGRLASLLSLCLRRGYVRENVCHRIERITIEQKAPKIFKLSKAVRVLLCCFRKVPKMLAWLSLSMLGGLRPEEAAKTSWDNIDLDKATCRIDESATKVRYRRIVKLTPACVAWLRLAQKIGSPLPISEQNLKRYRKKLRVAIGLQAWPQDITRHTAASHIVASSQNYAETAINLGTSEDELRTHYVDLVPKENGTKFVNLMPSKRMLESTLKLKKAA